VNKYGAIKTKVGDRTFDSKVEAARYVQLTMLARAGEISDLKCQPCFELTAYPKPGPAKTKDRILIGTYSPDFMYVDTKLNYWIYEDVKGGNATKTPLYKWKKKHVEAEYGIVITEVNVKIRR